MTVDLDVDINDGNVGTYDVAGGSDGACVFLLW